jgi:O-antigen/teichoic acid export membrane protein
LLPLYTRYLTPSDYGILEIFQVTVEILSIIFVMGISSALFMSYFNYEDQEKKKTVISTALIFLTVISLSVMILLLILSSCFSNYFFRNFNFTFHFQVIFLTLFFDIAIVIPFAVLRAKEESKKYIMISFARLLISVGLNIYFIVVLKKGVLGILESGLITSSLLYFILIPGIIKETRFRFSKADLKEMLHFGMPLVPANLASWILTMSDRYFLLFFSTSNVLGLYSLGYQFGSIVRGLVVVPFTIAWAPFLFSIAKDKKAKKIYSSVLTYFVLIGMFIALGVSILSKEVLIIMTTSPFYSAYEIIPLIALSYILYGCYFILCVGINLKKKTKFQPFIVGVGAILNLSLNFLLIPDYGMMGAAIATFISYLTLPIGAYLISRRYYPIEYEWKRLLKIFFVALIIYGGCFYITNKSTIISGLSKAIFILISYPTLLFVVKFFTHEEIQKGKVLIKDAPEYIKQRLTKIKMTKK